MDSYDSCYKKYTNNNLFMIKDLRSSRARSKVRSIEREQSKDYEENKSQLLFKGDLDQSVESLVTDWGVQKMRSNSSSKQFGNLSYSMISEAKTVPYLVQQNCEIIEELPEMQQYREPYIGPSRISQQVTNSSIGPYNPNIKKVVKKKENQTLLKKTKVTTQSSKQLNKQKLPQKQQIKTSTVQIQQVPQRMNKVIQFPGKENQDKSISRGSLKSELHRNSFHQTDEILQMIKKTKVRTKEMLEQRGQINKYEDVSKYIDTLTLLCRFLNEGFTINSELNYILFTQY